MNSVSLKSHGPVLLSMKLLPYPGESELFPVGIGQVKGNSIKTHGTSCYVTGELIAGRYFSKQKMKKSKISSKSTHFFSILSQAFSYILKLWSEQNWRYFSFKTKPTELKHRSLTLFLFLYLYTLYVVKGRTVTPLLHKLFLCELHRYYSGYNLVRIPFE